MANATMYSKKDKAFRKFPIKCEPSKDSCAKCPLRNNCDKKED